MRAIAGNIQHDGARVTQLTVAMAANNFPKRQLGGKRRVRGWTRRAAPEERPLPRPRFAQEGAGGAKILTFLQSGDRDRVYSI